MIEADIIAITGHRVYPDPAALYRGLNNLRANEYLFGGARGVDNDALEYIAKTQPSAGRTVVVPNRLIDQPQVSQENIKIYAKRLVELKNTGSDRYFIRNRYMVDHSTHVQAFYDFRGSGGTYQTINYARSTGKSVEIWRLYNSDINQLLDLNEQEFMNLLIDMKEKNVNCSSIKGIAVEYCKMKYGRITYKFVSFFRAWESGR